MKRIDITKMMKENSLDNLDERRILGMEFIKMGDKYLIKNSNGVIVDEKEKLKLENNEMVIKDVESNLCQKETTKKTTSRGSSSRKPFSEGFEETSPGVINTAERAKHKFAIAVIIKAVGKNFLTSEPSASTPFTNLPIP